MAQQDESTTIPVLTLALWVLCLAIGVLGFVFPYERPRRAVLIEPPQVNAIEVEWESKELPLPREEIQHTDSTEPLTLPRPAEAPEVPKLQKAPNFTSLLVVEPMSDHVIPPRNGVEAKPEPTVNAPPPSRTPGTGTSAVTTVTSSQPQTAPGLRVQTLILGEGEGNQPTPEYPRQAIRQGQEGSVLIRLSVDQNGKVIGVDTAVPSPWPLLNQAAIRAVRERWKFSPGSPRTYEVSIRFQLPR